MKKIKILVVGMSSVLAGTEMLILNYYRNIDKNKFQFDFVNRSTKKLIFQEELEKNNSKIFYIPLKKKNYFEYKKSINKLFYNGNYDVVWVNAMGLTNIDFVKLAKRNNCKHIIVHSHSSGNTYRYLRKWLHDYHVKKIYKYATLFFSCSNTAEEYMFPNIHKNKYIIKNAISLSKFKYREEERRKFRNKLLLDKKDKLLLNIGRISIQKNQSYLIDIFHEVRKSDDNIKLLIIGNVTENDKYILDDLNRRIKEYNLKEYITFINSTEEIAGYINAADCYIMTSIYEGLPLSAVEAQANGLPVILSDTISNETKINDNVEFLSLDDSKDLWSKNILNMIYSDRINEEKIISNFNENKFNIETEAKKFENILLGEINE